MPPGIGYEPLPLERRPVRTDNPFAAALEEDPALWEQPAPLAVFPEGRVPDERGGRDRFMAMLAAGLARSAPRYEPRIGASGVEHFAGRFLEALAAALGSGHAAESAARAQFDREQFTLYRDNERMNQANLALTRKERQQDRIQRARELHQSRIEAARDARAREADDRRDERLTRQLGAAMERVQASGAQARATVSHREAISDGRPERVPPYKSLVSPRDEQEIARHRDRLTAFEQENAHRSGGGRTGERLEKQHAAILGALRDRQLRVFLSLVKRPPVNPEHRAAWEDEVARFVVSEGIEDMPEVAEALRALDQPATASPAPAEYREAR